MRTLLPALALFFSVEAFGAFSPPNPTTYDFIRYSTVFSAACGWEAEDAVRNGSRITITFMGSELCLAVVSPASANIGFLPAGTYEVTVYTDQGQGLELYETATLVVAPAIRTSVPTLDARGMALLLAAVSIAGVFVMRRQM